MATRDGHALEGGPFEGVLAYLSTPDRKVAGEVLGEKLHSADTMARFLKSLGRGRWNAFIVSLEAEGVEEALVERIAGQYEDVPLFLTSRDGSVERVLAAEKLGAVALVPEPLDGEALEREIRPLLDEPGHVRVPEVEDEPSEPVVGTNPALARAFQVVARVARTPATLLVTGESGTGKELVAMAVHRQSTRSQGPFVPVNCAAIPDTLLEAELFGYERGAFTGAVSRSDGRFGRADGGTLFLDEVGEMSISLQAKLLRVLESGEVERLGSGPPARTDVRVVAATNRDLAGDVESGSFRRDLYFRLAVVQVELPPLRERDEDILPLALHFVARFSEAYGRPVRQLSREAVRRLRAYPWPGNVRELRNVMDRAVLLARGGVIRQGDLMLGVDSPRTSAREDGPEPGYAPTQSLREVEGKHIRAVLEHTGGHLGDAAGILGIHRNTMTMKVREHGLDVEAIAGRFG